jgi:hypothetical protein
LSWPAIVSKELLTSSEVAFVELRNARKLSDSSKFMTNQWNESYPNGKGNEWGPVRRPQNLMVVLDISTSEDTIKKPSVAFHDSVLQDHLSKDCTKFRSDFCLPFQSNGSVIPHSFNLVPFGFHPPPNLRDLEHNFGMLNSDPISNPFLPASLMKSDDQSVTREGARMI